MIYTGASVILVPLVSDQYLVIVIMSSDFMNIMDFVYKLNTMIMSSFILNIYVISDNQRQRLLRYQGPQTNPFFLISRLMMMD